MLHKHFNPIHDRDLLRWVAFISKEGITSMNATRPQEHRLRELVQNSLDSFGDGHSGRIRFGYILSNGKVEVVCEINGFGIEKRGRFGRWFTAAGVPSLTGPSLTGPAS
jgi:hypothetical protein